MREPCGALSHTCWCSSCTVSANCLRVIVPGVHHTYSSAPRGKELCASGTYSTQEVGTRNPYEQYSTEAPWRACQHGIVLPSSSHSLKRPISLCGERRDMSDADMSTSSRQHCKLPLRSERQRRASRVHGAAQTRSLASQAAMVGTPWQFLTLTHVHPPPTTSHDPPATRHPPTYHHPPHR